jgi:group I intron endonuclease
MEISKKYHTIYKITNLVNNKIYIGAHSTNNPNDSYMGSGTFIRKAIKKYGIENFSKEIISYHSTYKELYDEEQKIVNIEFIQRRDTYNMEIGGSGGKLWTKEMIDRMKEGIKRCYQNGHVNSFKGKSHTEKSKKLIKDNHADNAGEKNPMYGKPCYYNMTDEEKEIWRESIGIGNKGKKHTDEHKKN